LKKKDNGKKEEYLRDRKNKKNGYFLCEKCYHSHKIEEESDLLLDVLNQMQNQGQIPQNAKFEIDKESDEGGYFIRDPSLFTEKYYRDMKRLYGRK